MIAGEAEARNAPAADVAEFQGPASGNDARQRSAASVGCSENAADACSRNAGNGYAVLLENLQHAEMRKAARKSAAESDADARPTGQWGCIERPGLRFTYHGESIAILKCGSDSSGVPKNQYVCTFRKSSQKAGGKTYRGTFLLREYPPCTIPGF